MRRRSAGWLAAPVLLAAVLAVGGCTQPASGPPGSGQPGSPQLGSGQPGSRQHGRQIPGASGRADSRLAAVRRGLNSAAGGRAYYLALGDSLSRGIQPTATGRDAPTARGYPDLLAARLTGTIAHLRLVKLGCSGETTTTMIHGGICRYPAGSQLAQAAAFLRSHRGSTALVTIDIGANDPNSCIIGAPPGAIFSCLTRRVPTIKRNLGTILAALRSAAGRRVLIVGMTYYVPALGLWRSGRTGRQIGMLTDGFAAGMNRLLTGRYHRYGARVADVYGAFRSLDFGGVRPTSAAPAWPPPPNVTVICSLTWMCARPPRGPNEHANDAGYRVITRAFWRAIAG
jgi:lysophospholipase L1-like esterase